MGDNATSTYHLKGPAGSYADLFEALKGDWLKKRGVHP